MVFLDDTAQLDLLLSNNTGQNIQPVGPGALYPGDPLKQNGIVRNVQIFQVDDTAGGLDTNTWSNIPVSQQTLFLNAGYWTTQVTPWSLNNPNFPQDFNTSPGDPFLP